MKSEFAIRFQISENIGVMLNFSVFKQFWKINGERGILCRDFAPVTIYGNWPDELKLRSSDAT